MKVIIKEPKRNARVIDIDNTLEALQKAVGGFIEAIYYRTDGELYAVLCDEEGRLYDKPYNCDVQGISFVGTILIVGVDGEEFTDAPAAWLRGIGYLRDEEVAP